MNEAEIREVLVEAIESSTIVGLRQTGLREQFLAGTADISFSALEMDSMGAMELCIAVELNTGVELVPGELAELDSLAAVVASVKARQS